MNKLSWRDGGFDVMQTFATLNTYNDRICSYMSLQNIKSIQKLYIKQVKDHQGWDNHKKVFIEKYKQVIVEERVDEKEKRYRCCDEIAILIIEYMYECYNHEVLEPRIYIHRLIMKHMKAYEGVRLSTDASMKKIKRFRNTLKKLKLLGKTKLGDGIDAQYLLTPIRFQVESYYDLYSPLDWGITWKINEHGQLLYPFWEDQDGNLCFKKITHTLRTKKTFETNSEWKRIYPF